jgi:hypothetical protein
MMTKTEAPGDSQNHSHGDMGWYLYGIVRRGSPDIDCGVALQMLECGSVAAVAKTVPLADFSDEALQKRVQDPGTLAELVTDHNAVIATIHDQMPILPAKFGGVYAQVEGLLAAIEGQHEALAAQLDRVDGCDEWAVHVYLNRDRFGDEIAASDPVLNQLRQDAATASPGRAYLLQRKLAEGITRAITRESADLSRQCLEQLERPAVAAQPGPASRAPSGPSAEMEILKAAFLVKREMLDAFDAEAEAISINHAELRCERSGPWPPYSFASVEEKGS